MSRKARIIYQVQKSKPHQGNKVEKAISTYNWLKNMKPDAVRSEAWIKAELEKVGKKLRKYSVSV